jgi:Archaeal TRASH domain
LLASSFDASVVVIVWLERVSKYGTQLDKDDTLQNHFIEAWESIDNEPHDLSFDRYKISEVRRLNSKPDSKFKLKRGLKIKLDCEFCSGPISAEPHVFKFANYERFFCCTGCMSGYKQKYAGKIESIKRNSQELTKVYLTY